MKIPRTTHRLASAFSLVEVVLALGLSAFALTSMIALLPAGLVASRESRGSLEAMRAADRVMSDLRMAVPNADGVFESRVYEIPFSAQSGSKIFEGENGSGRQIVEVNFVNRPGNDGTETGLYETIVSVFWGVPENASTPPAGHNNFVRLYGAFTK